MYPVCLNITGRLCIVIGGGIVAERKVRGLLAAGGRVRVISPEATAALADLAREGRIEWLRRPYAPGDLDRAFLVFAATDSRGVQEAVCRDAQQAAILVNVADDPDRCSFQVPATVHRGDLTLSVATGGRSPAVAAMIRRRLERDFGPEYAVLLELVAMIRQEVLSDDRSPGERKILFQNILHDDIVSWIREGRWDRLQQHLQEVLGPGHSLDLSRLKQEFS
ncbi:MAG TPA: bifunctional precorrin-2 dehydrogenase/sirohydrochlorin ferrochelatase [Desulfobulbus sp.]|nr:bifunctional precorrin-2 dehydrogenase/sirohydrochlorin ferrochelatase [Desulfobulbus sp.]